MQRLIEAAGFVIDKITYQNILGRFGWWLNGRVLKRAHLPGGQSRLFDYIVPILRRVEPKNPSKGLSLIAVGTKPLASADAATRSA